MPGAAAAWPEAEPILSVPVDVLKLAMVTFEAETTPPSWIVSVPVPDRRRRERRYWSRSSPPSTVTVPVEPAVKADIADGVAHRAAVLDRQRSRCRHRRHGESRRLGPGRTRAIDRHRPGRAGHGRRYARKRLLTAPPPGSSACRCRHADIEPVGIGPGRARAIDRHGAGRADLVADIGNALLTAPPF